MSGGRAARRAALAAALAWAAAGPAPAQNLPAEHPDQVRHLRAVYAERCERFFERWESAGSEARERVVACLRELAASPRASRAWPSTEELSIALRVLDGAEPAAAQADLQARLADGLDLQVVPGAFEPTDGARGEPLTVRVWPTGPVRAQREVVVRLVWIAPDGAETVARTEPVAPAALRPPGFEMYLRAPAVVPPSSLDGPLGDAGEPWHLAPEVEIDGRRVRGFPVPVHCVPGFGERVDALSELGELGEPGHSGEPADAADASGALASLRALRKRGVRAADGLGPAALLARLEDPGAGAGPRRLAAPSGMASDAGPAPPPAWIWRATEDTRGLLVVVAPEQQSAGALFRGTLGRRWIDVAARTGRALVSLELGEAASSSLAVQIDELRAGRAADEPLALVLRGDAVTRVQMQAFLLGGERPRVDELLLCLDAAPSSFPVEAGRTLVVVPIGARAVESGGAAAEGPEVVEGGPTPFLTEPLLPDVVAGWLEP